MSNKEAEHAIRTCKWRDDAFKHQRDMRQVICRGMCLPCLRVIETGECDTLLKLARKENAENQRRKNNGREDRGNTKQNS